MVVAALIDFTGGIGEGFPHDLFRTPEKTAQLYKMLVKCQERKTLLGTSVEVYDFSCFN